MKSQKKTSQVNSIKKTIFSNAQNIGTKSQTKLKSFFSPKNIIQRKEDQINRNNILNPPITGGTVYDSKGKKIGKTKKDGTEVIILFRKDLVKRLNKQKKIAKKENTTFKIELSELDASSYFTLPPFEHRQNIKSILEEDSTNGYTEFGGRGLIPVESETGKLMHDKFVHIRSKDGLPASPSDDAASIRLNEIHENEKKTIMDKIPSGNYALDYTWHSHPGGEWKKKEGGEKWLTAQEYERIEKEENLKSTQSGASIGGPAVSTKEFGRGPSIQDITNAHNRYNNSKDNLVTGTDGHYLLTKNFVIHKKQDEVYFYNQNTEIEKGNFTAKMKLQDFYDLKN